MAQRMFEVKSVTTNPIQFQYNLLTAKDLVCNVTLTELRNNLTRSRQTTITPTKLTLIKLKFIAVANYVNITN